MKKEIMEKLRRVGVDTESAIERFMGNEALYTKFAIRFIDDKNYEALANALETGDGKNAFAAAHTLKGTCGNLSFVSLYRAASELVEPLRGGDMESAREKLLEFAGRYYELIEILREWKDEEERARV